MPSNWLNVPHFQQELEYSCVAACVRVVLAHYGDIRTEADLRLLLDTQPTGTRAGNLIRLAGAAYEVYVRPSNVVELQQVLADTYHCLSQNGIFGILECRYLAYR